MPQMDLQGWEGLGHETVEHLHLLVAEWQVLADLGFGDVHLMVPDRTVRDAAGRRRPGPGASFEILAHARPGTAMTLFPLDQIGRRLGEGKGRMLTDAWQAPGVVARRNAGQGLSDRLPPTAQCHVVTLILDGDPVALVTLTFDCGRERAASPAEASYRGIADELLRMAGAGAWPQRGTQPSPRRGSPRVGDGVIRLDAQDRVEYMSPNAISAVARLGAGETAVGQMLTSAIDPQAVPGEQVDEDLMGVLRGRVPGHGEVSRGRTAVMFRSIPLSDADGRRGALLLCRDVSELRRRERELSSKDAAIRETHHRVKNSLQAVAALMRMQSRRAEGEDTRRGLSEAMRRLEAVSMVHETLSHTPDGPVDFDAHFSRQIRAITELAGSGQSVGTRLSGRFGELPGHQVTPMALVLNELLSNAVEHGLRGRDGTIEVRADRRPLDRQETDGTSSGRLPSAELVVTVEDDGIGLGAEEGAAVRDDAQRGVQPAGLGSQIVRNLVGGELDGTIVWLPREGGGTSVRLRVLLYDAAG